MSGPWEEFANEESGPWADFSAEQSSTPIPGVERENTPFKQPGLGTRMWQGLAPKNIGDTFTGLGDAALNVGTGAAAFPIGLAVGAKHLLTGDTKGADAAAGKAMEDFTWKPRTELGTELGGDVGELINQIGIPAMGMGRLPDHGIPMPKKVKGVPDLQTKLDALKKEEVKAPWEDFGPDAELLPSNAPQYGIDHSNNAGMWTKGEDGHPFRADLSMDVPLQENPLQRNLFGDDMVPTANAERTTNQAMDQMASEGGLIPDAVNKLKEDVSTDGDMQQAHYDNSDIATEGPFSIPRNQRGAVDVNALLEGLFGAGNHGGVEGFRKMIRGGIQEKLRAKALITDRLRATGHFQWNPGDKIYSPATRMTYKILDQTANSKTYEPQYRYEIIHDGAKPEDSFVGSTGMLNAEKAHETLQKVTNIPPKQRGAIDLKALEDGFYKHKFLDNGILLGIRGREGVESHVEAIDPKGRKIGETRMMPDQFNFDENSNLNAGWTHVDPEHRGKGIAEQMYKFAAEHIGDIKPSDTQTSAGKKMWQRFEQEGISKGMTIPRSQRGAIDFGPPDEVARKRSEKIIKSIAREHQKQLDDPVFMNELAKGIEEELTQAREYIRTEQPPNYKIGQRVVLPDGQRGTLTRQVYNRKTDTPKYQIKFDKDIGENEYHYFVTEDQFKSVVTSKPKLVPPKQRGAIDLGESKRQHVADIMKERLFAPEPVPAETLSSALMEGKDGKGINSLEAGATLAAAKRKSALVRDASRWVQGALKRAELNIREKVFPVERALKQLTKQEIIDLGAVFKKEMFDGHVMTLDILNGLGLSAKQLDAYAQVREVFKDTARIQNETRVAAGLKPFTEREAYLSSRWKGDFRRPMLDKEGRLKWYLAADSKRGLEKQTQALLKEFPDLVAGKDSVVQSGKNRTDIQSMYSTVLDILGRDDPATIRIKEWVEQQTVEEGRSAFGQEKHFKNKANTRGFTGDRPGIDPFKDNIDMFHEQIQYAKNAYKWAEMQKAGEKLKTVLADKDLIDQQPNNVNYVKDYFRNQIGMGEHKLAKAFEDTLRDGGVSPSVISNWVGGVKSAWIMQKLIGLGYVAANVIQTTAVLPHMADLMAKGHGKNPVTPLLMGFFGGALMGTGHYMNAAGGNLYHMMARMPDGKFLQRAFKYAEDNGVTSRSVYDESPVETAFSKTSAIANKASLGLTVPETYVRSFAYMAFVQQLREGGKFKGRDLELFREAEERVNMAMVDYREGERGLIFSKAGIVGNLMNTLQTYPLNFYQQWNYFVREASKGNVLPGMAALGTAYAVGGAMGIPGMNDLDKLWTFAKDHMPTEMWAKVKDFNPKVSIIEHFGEASLYGPLSTESGIALTSRVTAPSGADMIQAPGGPIADIAKQVGSVASLAMDPLNKTKQTQALMDVAPVGIQGLLETGPLKDRMYAVNKKTGEYGPVKKATDLASETGMFKRTPKDETMRAMGLRSQDEVLEKDMAYAAGSLSQQVNKRASDLVGLFYNAVSDGDKEKASRLDKLYTELTGHSISDQSFDKQIKDNYMTAVQRASTGAKTIQALQSAKRMKEILDEHYKGSPQ